MPRWVASVVFICTISCAQIGGQPKTGKQSQGEVSGMVTLIANNLGIVGIGLNFKTLGHEYHTVTDSQGSYTMKLPTGIYTMTVYRPGLCRMRREAFIVSPDAKIHFDFKLMTCPSDIDAKFNYAVLDAPAGSEIRPLVLFGDSTTDGHVLKYRSLAIPDIVPTDEPKGPSQRYGHAKVVQNHYPIVLTYNLLTVRSTELSYDQEKGVVIATGDVEVQDGNETKTGARAEIVLRGSEAKIEITR